MGIEHAKDLAKDLKTRLLQRWGAEEILIPDGAFAFHVVPASFWYDYVNETWVEIPPGQRWPGFRGKVYFDMTPEGKSVKEDKLWEALASLADLVAPKDNPGKTLVWAHYENGGVNVILDGYCPNPEHQRYVLRFSGTFSGIGSK